MKELHRKLWADYIGERRLNIGCGAAVEPGWENMDFKPQAPSVIQWDVRQVPWPVEHGVYDTVLASHFLEHFRDEDLFNIMAEVGHVLKVGGHLIAIVPYALHSDAWGNPYHKQLWDEATPTHFFRSTYERKGTAGTGADQYMPLANWSMPYMGLVPDEFWWAKPAEEIELAKRGQMNVIREMQFVLRRES